MTVSCLDSFRIDSVPTVIGVTWQVVATFTSIAFAGLTVLMQVASEPVVTSRGARQILFEETQFRPVLAFAITTSVQVGFAALFFDRTESAIVEMLVVALTILWIGLSYARVGLVFAKPGEALRLGQAALLSDLMASMRQAHSRAVAESRLHDLVPRYWSALHHDPTETSVLVTSNRAGVLADVDFDMLNDIVNQIADNDSSALVAAAAPGQPAESSAANAPELRIATSLGASLEPGQMIFLLANASSFTGDLTGLQSRLTSAVRWGESQ